MRVLSLALLVAVAVALTPADAHAYIDPSAGSVVLQVVLAGVLGAAFTLKMTWRRLVAYVRALFARDRA